MGSVYDAFKGPANARCVGVMSMQHSKSTQLPPGLSDAHAIALGSEARVAPSRDLSTNVSA